MINSTNDSSSFSDILSSQFSLTQNQDPDQPDLWTINVDQSISSFEERSKLLDLQCIDFLGPADAMKRLFSYSYSDTCSTFAIHRIGGTLMLDGIVNEDVFVEEMTNNVEQQSTKSSPSSPNKSSNLDKNINTIKGLMFDSLSPTKLALTRSSNKLLITSNTNSSSQISTISSNNLSFLQIKESSLRSVIKERTDHRSPSISPTKSGNAENLSMIPVNITGSPYLPPPRYFMPAAPAPSKSVQSWDLHDLRLAIESDLTVYRLPDNRNITLRPLDTTQAASDANFLDYYLDNVLSNVPELALALHAKGFIRGVRICLTRDIPYLNSSDVTTSTIGPIHFYSSQASKNHQFYHQNIYDAIPSSDASNISNDFDVPLFDPKVIDFDASTIMRFLKENCCRDESTYLLYRSNNDETPGFHLYDLSLASSQKQRQFKWMLAMLSYRFGVKLGNHIKSTSCTHFTKVQMRIRQMRLYSTCNQLLLEIREMGGDHKGHATIRASVLEQMADTHLLRIEEHLVSNNSSENRSNKSKTHLEDDFDRGGELSESISLLNQAADCLVELINVECDFEKLEIEKMFKNLFLFYISSNPKDSNEADTFLPKSKKSRKKKKNSKVGSENVDESIVTNVNNSYINEGSITAKNLMVAEDLQEDDTTNNHTGSDANEAFVSVDIIETLSLQLAGVLHKLTQATVILVLDNIKAAKLLVAINTLAELINPLLSWARVRKFLRSQYHTIKLGKDHENNDAATDSYDSNIEQREIWGADMTILQSLPLLWNVLGEINREVFKQTAGVSINNPLVQKSLAVLILSFRELSKSLDFTNIDELLIIDNRHDKKTSLTSHNMSINSWYNLYYSEASKDSSFLFGANNFKTDNNNNNNNNSKRNDSNHIDFEKSFRVLSYMVKKEEPNMCCRVINEVMIILHQIISPVILLSNRAPIDHAGDITYSLNKQAPSAFIGITYNYSQNKSFKLLIERLFENNNNSSNNIDNLRNYTDPEVREGVRRLADSCNAIGQHLLQLVRQAYSHYNNMSNNDQNNNTKQSLLSTATNSWSALLLAEQLLLCSFLLFETSDDILNSCTICCNISSLLRIKAAWLLISNKTLSITDVSTTYNKWKHEQELSDNNDYEGDLSLLESSTAALNDALYFSTKAISLLEKIDNIPTNYISNSNSTTNNNHDNSNDNNISNDINKSSTPQASRSNIIFENIRRSTYTMIANETAHAYLALAMHRKRRFFPKENMHMNESANSKNMIIDGESMMAALEERATEVEFDLEQALKYFREVNNERQIAAVHFQLGSFYSQLWPLSTVSSNECVEKNVDRLSRALDNYREAHRYYSKCDVSPTLVMILLDMFDLHFSSNNEAVIELLTGSFQSLLECRFAFTPLVISRYGVHHLDKLALEVMKRTSKLLMNVLKENKRKSFEKVSTNMNEMNESDGSNSVSGIYKSLVYEISQLDENMKLRQSENSLNSTDNNHNVIGDKAWSVITSNRSFDVRLFGLANKRRTASRVIHDVLLLEEFSSSGGEGSSWRTKISKKLK
eukprot:gene8376-11333_t